MSATRIHLLIGLGMIAAFGTPEVRAQSDWDLYILRLVNRTRQDPAGEPGRIGSSVTDAREPVAPLAYDLTIAQSAQNHNDWMHENLGSISSGNAPDSFTHYETLDGSPTGTSASGTPGFTGVNIEDRVTYVGFVWDRVGENLACAANTAAIPVDEGQIDANHYGWWESDGHRDIMLHPDFTLFGHYAESRGITPPIGNLTAPFKYLHFATQNYARPLHTPNTYMFGLLYEDRNNSGDWTPRDDGHALREGLAAVGFQVFSTETATVSASGTTMANGAFSINIGDGTYDLVFTDVRLPGGSLTVSDITVAGANTEIGDLEINAGGNVGDSGADGTSGSLVVAPPLCGAGVSTAFVSGLIACFAVRLRKRTSSCGRC